LQVNRSLLLAVINRGVGKNSNDLVHEYRMREFQHRARLPANQHLTLLGSALDCGFNSKATFNRVFKKMTGKSPSEWVSDGGNDGVSHRG
jgi:AraC-like DNA-binding protein